MAKHDSQFHIQPPGASPSSSFDPETTDADLLRAYTRSRDDAAFGRLAARHSRALRRIAWRHTRNEAAAEDVAQAALIVLAQKPRPALRSARRKGTVLPWLSRVTRYAAGHWRRAETRRYHRESIAARAPVAGDPPGSRDLAEAVTRALSTLPRRQRRLIVLHYIESKSWSEVAARTHTTPDAARKAATRAMGDLRAALEKQGITAAPTIVAAGLTATATSSASATVPALTAAELAKGVLTMLKLKTATTASASVILLASAGLFVATVGAEETPTTGPATAAAHSPLLQETIEGLESYMQQIRNLRMSYTYEVQTREGESWVAGGSGTGEITLATTDNGTHYRVEVETLSPWIGGAAPFSRSRELLVSTAGERSADQSSKSYDERGQETENWISRSYNADFVGRITYIEALSPLIATPYLVNSDDVSPEATLLDVARGTALLRQRDASGWQWQSPRLVQDVRAKKAELDGREVVELSISLMIGPDPEHSPRHRWFLDPERGWALVGWESEAVPWQERVEVELQELGGVWLPAEVFTEHDKPEVTRTLRKVTDVVVNDPDFDVSFAPVSADDLYLQGDRSSH